MEEKIKALKEQMEAALGHVDSKEQLAEFWQNFLGKKGSIANLMKGLGSVPKEDRPNVGKTINEFKNQVETRYQEMKNKMDELELAAALALAFFHVFFLLITKSWSRQSQAETDRAALRA